MIEREVWPLLLAELHDILRKHNFEDAVSLVVDIWWAT